MITSLGSATLVKQGKIYKELKVPLGAKIQVVRDNGEGYITVCAKNKNVLAYAGGDDGSETAGVNDLVWPKTENWIELSFKGKRVYAEDNGFYMGRYNENSKLKCK